MTVEAGSYREAVFDAGRAFVEAINDLIGSDEAPEHADQGMVLVNVREEVLDGIDSIKSALAKADALLGKEAR